MSGVLSVISSFLDRWPVRLSAIVGAVLAAMLATGIWLGSVATSSVDKVSLQRQVGLASNAIDALFASVPNDQESVTIWDDTVERAKAGDQDWMSENIGEWMSTYFGF